MNGEREKPSLSKPPASADKEPVFEVHTPIDDDRPIYLVGPFNDWQVDPRFQLRQAAPGRHTLPWPLSSPPSLPLEYKYVKGNWDGEEVDPYGSQVNNRLLSEPQPKIVDTVPRWKSEGRAYKPELLPRIQIIDEHFEIPQLIKTRRIAALLPHDYDRSERRYPVLYLQDGQNLFDDYAPFGNWAVDKRLAVMAERGTADLIIISIDHAESERIAEFTPSYQTRLGPGDGKKYVRFLADTLKPYVDKHFRTLPDRQHTGIGGSSMGGLISIYAGLMYPEVYGKLMIFSPSLWVAPNIHFHAINLEESLPTRIYLYAGGAEGANMIPNVERYREALEKNGLRGTPPEFRLSVDPQGQHNEERWGREFPLAAEWLFFS